MKALKDFDYDLWTTDDNLCMVRVKATGEECEVSRETFRLLRAEEKRLRRERTPEKGDGIQDKVTKSTLSLDIFDTDSEGAFWHTDPRDHIGESIFVLTHRAFLATLTDTQQKVYWLVIVNGLSYKRCADICGVAYQSVQKMIQKIRRKAKIFFS